jgi:hypothetical protein
VGTHTIGIVIRSGGPGMVPPVADGSIADIERVAAEAVRDSGLLPKGCEVVMPDRQPGPTHSGASGRRRPTKAT